MRGVFVALALLVVPAGVGTAAFGQPAGPVSELIRAQTELIARTREYRESLDPVLGFQEAEAARAESQARSHRELLDRGLVARREVEALEALAQAARARVDETRQRMGEADALMGETFAAIEVAKMPRTSPGEVVSTSTMIRYQGTVELAAGDVASIETFFSEQFGRALPVSALGQTPVHDRMGLDHRHALDVAVRPDSDEGKALMAYLRRERIPFLAFKGPVPGASTGAHIHIGQVSPRLIPAKAAGR
jgi:hypothetical protein